MTEEKTRKRAYLKSNMKFYLAYTGLAVLLCLVICSVFYYFGKSFIWKKDGLRQHCIGLAYYGIYLRNVVKNLIVYHKFSIPMWDLHIGFGSDILTTLHYYTIGDPLNLLAVLVPEKYTEYLYCFLILFRMYLAGITFSRYCFYHKNGKVQVLMGSLMYAFSMWMLTAGFNHPYFINPCIYLPLILLGADKVLDQKKPFLYIGAIALSALSNFYFFYMLGIITVIYVVFRYFMIYKRWENRTILGLLGGFSLYSIDGILISGIILFPVLKAVMGADRMKVKHYVPLLYEKSFYEKFFSMFIGGRLSRFTIAGIAAVGLLTLAVLFLQRKKYPALVLGVAVLTGMLLVPWIGHAMNGFSYATNRWCWAFLMLVTYIFVKMYPEFFCLSGKKRLALLGAAGLYALYMFFTPGVNSRGNIAAAGLAFLLTGAFLAGYRLFQGKRVLWHGLVLVSIMVSISGNIWFAFGEKEDGEREIWNYQDLGSFSATVHGETELALKELPDIHSVRFGQNRTNMLQNSAMLNDLSGGQFYFSLPSDGISTFFQENYLESSQEQRFTGVDNRAWLLKLFSTKYFAVRMGNEPDGFKEVEGTGLGSGKTGIYQDEAYLPLAYTYDTAISQEEYAALSPVQKQEAMMESAVMEKSSLPKGQLEFTSAEIPFTVRETDGVEFENGRIYVRKNKASVILSLEGEENCETGLAFTNLRYLGGIGADGKTPDLLVGTEAQVRAWIPSEKNKNVRRVILRSPRDNFQSERSNFMLNLGYHREKVDSVKLFFLKKGIYEVEAMKAYCQKTDSLNEWAKKRREEAPGDLAIDGNRITCSVDFSGTRALVFSIPYSEGWKLTVDGRPQELLKANRMFMAAELSAGHHEIELNYRTPCLEAGIVGTIAGLGILILLKVRLKSYVF